MSPVLHGLILSRDQTMQGAVRNLGGTKHVVERLSRDAVTTEDSHHVAYSKLLLDVSKLDR